MLLECLDDSGIRPNDKRALVDPRITQRRVRRGLGVDCESARNRGVRLLDISSKRLTTYAVMSIIGLFWKPIDDVYPYEP